MDDLIASSSIQDIKRGFHFQPETNAYRCLVCGDLFTKGHIFPSDGAWLDAETAAASHIESQHTSIFDALLQLDKKQNGLTDLQRDLLTRFYRGDSDEEIVAGTSIGSRSTVRNHRHSLREREKQARVFVAIMELISDKFPDRAASTTRRKEHDGPLKLLPRREKKRAMIIESAANRFEMGREYGVAEVNTILKSICDDYATLRRHLIGYGYLKRDPDGRRYWVNQTRDSEEDAVKRHELKLQYKHSARPAGIYQIKNRANGRVLVESSFNLDGSRNRFNFEVRNGCLRNHPDLQREWNEFGAEQFTFEILEELDPRDEPLRDPRSELAKLERKWLDKLQPYGDRGYNRPPKE